MTKPTDPLVTKLVEMLRRGNTPSVPSAWSIRDLTPFTGIPMEEAALKLRGAYRDRLTRYIDNLRTTHSQEWSPGDWVAIVPPYLFPGETEIGGIEVLATCPIDWAVFLSRSPQWFSRVVIRDSKTRFAPTEFVDWTRALWRGVPAPAVSMPSESTKPVRMPPPC
jgi:hypothetical protein